MGKSTNIRKNGNNKHTVKVNPKSNDSKENPVWMFDMIDRSGKYAFDINREDFKHKEVLDKIISYSSMTWADIDLQTHDKSNKSKNHYIPVNEMSKEALDRLKIKELEEYSDDIFSFAFQNKLRVIGIRDGKIFHRLWYDPKHEICPSTLKHS